MNISYRYNPSLKQRFFSVLELPLCQSSFWYTFGSTKSVWDTVWHITAVRMQTFCSFLRWREKESILFHVWLPTVIPLLTISDQKHLTTSWWNFWNLILTHKKNISAGQIPLPYLIFVSSGWCCLLSRLRFDCDIPNKLHPQSAGVTCCW